jgi:hypothetical protein
MGRTAARTNMCAALLKITAVVEKSAQLFDSMARSLMTVYDGNEIATSEGKRACSKVVSFLGILAAQGFLKGTLADTKQIYAELTSEFVGTSIVVSGGSDRSRLAEVAEFEQGVSLTEGIMRGLTAGQTPVSLLTSNVRAMMKNDLASSLANASLTPLATKADTAYQTLQPTINVVGNCLSQCASSDGYVELTTLQFGSNPHSGSDDLLSPLLFSNQPRPLLPQIDELLRKIFQSSPHYTSSTTSISNTTSKTTVPPAYYITLHFTSKQE